MLKNFLLFFIINLYSSYLFSSTDDVEALSSENPTIVEGTVVEDTPQQVVDDLPQNVEELKRRFLEVDSSLNEIREQLRVSDVKRIILSVGITGSGKSTLQNLLAGKTLRSEKASSGDYILTTTDNVPFPMGQGASVTRNPKCYVHEHNALIDLPGLWDNRGATANAAVSYALFKIFKTFMSENFNVPIKVLLYMPDEMIRDDRGLIFSPFINAISHIFGDNLENFAKACSIVPTKQTGRMQDGQYVYMNEEGVKATFSRWLENLANLTPFAKKLTALLSTQQTDSSVNVHGFRMPEKSGDVDYTALVQSILTDCQTTSRFSITPKMFISDDVRIHLNDLDQAISERAIDLLQNGVHRLFMETVQNTEGTQQTRKSFGQWKNNLTKLFQGTQNQTLISNFEEFCNKIKELYAPYASHFAEFESMLDMISFIQHANNASWSSLSQWESRMKNILGDAENLAQSPQVQSENGNVFIKGSLIGMDEVARLIQSDTKKLHILAKQALIINHDFKRQTQSEPFLMVCSSPIWKIVGERTIDLSGKHATNYTAAAAVGVNGAPGNPGFTGGSFYGFGERSIDLSKLTINTSGGQGGKGQQGGSGRAGADGAGGSGGTGGRNYSYKGASRTYNAATTRQVLQPVVAAVMGTQMSQYHPSRETHRIYHGVFNKTFHTDWLYYWPKTDHNPEETYWAEEGNIRPRFITITPARPAYTETVNVPAAWGDISYVTNSAGARAPNGNAGGGVSLTDGTRPVTPVVLSAEEIMAILQSAE